MARAIPLEEQTATNTILSLMRILGMSLGPFINAFLAGVDCTMFGMKVTQLNSVGIVVMLLNIVACLLIYFFLEDLPVRRDRKLSVSQYEIESVKDDRWAMLKAFFTLEILVPFFCTFVYNANFQLIETAFAPAAHHALQWGTVETSGVLGSVSVIIAACMFLVYVLSKNYKVVDEMLMGMGLVFSVVAYTFLYFSWKDEAAAWHFWFPVVLSAAAFPFISAPTISVFTKHVEHKPALQPHHGTMQAILGMSASIAGFVTPSVVAIYILRHPDQVDASEDHRELTPLGLYAPIISLVNLIGLLYVEFVKRPLANPKLPKYKPEASPMYVRRPIQNKTLVSPIGERTPLFLPLNNVSESEYTIADDELPRMRFLQGGAHLMAEITTSGGRGTFMLSTMHE
jgi:MFS family permease